MASQISTSNGFKEENMRAGHSTTDISGGFSEAPDGPRTKSPGPPAANRHRLPHERVAITHHFSVGGHEGYLTVGLYPNGEPGEIFIRMAKEGSTIAGLMECFGTVVSVSLQHGVPLRVLCDKLSHTRFEPSGWTGNERIGYAKSIMDYIFRWIEARFLTGISCRSSITLSAGHPASKGRVLPLLCLREALKKAMYPGMPPCV
jgi:ribonucleoside-diphosphate reductase alpha chain